MKTHGSQYVLCSILAPCFIAAVAWAQPPSDKEPPKPETSAETRSRQSRTMNKQMAASFELSLQDRERTKLKLHKEPLLRFTNPIVGQMYGAFFIWTNQGRPEAAVSVINWYEPRRKISLEFQSLARSRLTAYRAGEPVWQPEGPGVALKPLDGAPAPSASAPGRLRQMRSLARQFTVEADGENRAVTEDGPLTLRMLSRPIYRYQSANPDVLDGALFAFVRGTDPELLLLIEAHRSGDGHRWEYAFGRMNSLEFRVSRGRREVLRLPQLAPPWPNIQDRTKTYTLFRFVDP